MPKCRGCGVSYPSLRSLKRHWAESHGGDLWPDGEDLGPTESEQRDFDGEEPDESEHDPEYVVDTEKPDTERTRLGDYS